METMKRLSPDLLILVCLALVIYFIPKLLGSSAPFFVTAFALAYLSQPAVQWLECHHVRRGLAVITMFVVTLGAITLGMFYLVPALFHEIQSLISDLPRLVEGSIKLVSRLLGYFRLSLDMSSENISNYLMTHLSEVFKNLSAPLWNSATALVSKTLAVAGWVMDFILFPIFFFFLIQEYERIVHFIKNLVPLSRRKSFLYYAEKLNSILAGYFRGQLLVCIALAFMYGTGLAFSGIRYGLLIGIIAGALSLIPYVGFTVGLASSILITLINDGSFGDFLGIAITFSVAQLIETYILTPRLVGNRVGLSPLATILVLVAGANLGGFTGLLISIPVGGILKILVGDLLVAYRKSSVYQA
jgi:predicted PurR-regulated permease PerM